jgi:hypothetical protein
MTAVGPQLSPAHGCHLTAMQQEPAAQAEPDQSPDVAAGYRDPGKASRIASSNCFAVGNFPRNRAGRAPFN